MDDQEKELQNAENTEKSTGEPEPEESREARAEKHARAQSNLDELMRVLDQAEGKQTSKISKVEITHKKKPHAEQPAPEPAEKPEPKPEPETKPEKAEPQREEPKERPARRTEKQRKPQKEAEKPLTGAAARKRKREEQRRRRRRARIALVIAVVILVVIAVAAIVHGIVGLASGDAKSANGSGSGSAVAAIDTSQPASQQETAQYLAIKDDDDLPDYAKEYPGLYADAVAEENTESDEKVCYLTFDDGPASTVTPEILDALKEAGVKATFFLVGSEIDGNEDLVKRMVDEGHTICIHANEHDYGMIYPSVEEYLADFAEVYDKIYELTGYRVQGLRFPGGSNNVVMQRHDTYDAIVEEMTRRGFEYYDWNAYDHDAEGEDYTAEELVDYAVDEVTASSRTDVILLMHDAYGKETTAEALPDIISQLQDAGIELKPITNTSRPVHFEVDDSTPSEFPTDETSSEDESESDSAETDESESE